MGYDLDKNFNLISGSKRHKSVIDTLTGKANKSIASENVVPTRSASNDTTANVTWTDDLLDREIELCRANAQRYQKRLMELQEVAMARGVMRSSSNASNPSSAHDSGSRVEQGVVSVVLPVASNELGQQKSHSINLYAKSTSQLLCSHRNCDEPTSQREGVDESDNHLSMTITDHGGGSVHFAEESRMEIMSNNADL